MRDDLTRACVPCRARFSARHTDCPVCGARAVEARVARDQVEPPAWAAWAVKWATLALLLPLAVLLLVSVEVSGAQLQAGERVRVVGEVEPLALPGDYRTRRTCDLFVASDAAPVVISSA